MPLHTIDSIRRGLIRLAIGGAVPAPIAGLVGSHWANAAEEPKLNPASERAKEFDYTDDAATTNNAKREANARCATCTHFHGDEETSWASCNIFPNHKVSADGWCTSWFKKSA